MDNKYFNNKLKELRKSGNLTQQQVASVLGIKLNTYAHMEKDGKRPSFDMLEKLSKLFSVSVNELTGTKSSSGNLLNIKEEPSLILGNRGIFDENGIELIPPAFMMDLKSNEQDIILRYRLLSEEEKKKVLNYVNRTFNNRDTK